MAAEKKRRSSPIDIKMYFSDYFEVSPQTIKSYGAFNISLLNDLPLFIDPFLLFASEKPRYQELHDENIIEYLKFLRDASLEGALTAGRLRSWYRFPEVKQLWLGFSLHGNGGRGLGKDFANALGESLIAIFSGFGNERITQATHLEKLCLIRDGVGKDCISDFTANLIKPFLCEYTQAFAKKHLKPVYRRKVSVSDVYFDYRLQSWMPKVYELPWYNNDYVLLTPRDLLSKEENWINRPELVDGLAQIAQASDDLKLRHDLSTYLRMRLKEDMTRNERRNVLASAIKKYPEIIEHYILQKERNKDKVIKQSALFVEESESFYIEAFRRFASQLAEDTEFYRGRWDTLEEARQRVMYMKHVIEKCGGYRIFYHKGKAVQRESDLQLLFRLTWFASPSDFNGEVNNGSGPVDFKASRGSGDSSLVEFKLAKNSQLKRNLESQVETYKQTNQTKKALTVIFFFSDSELTKVQKALLDLKLDRDPDLILVDVRNDNKPSGSKA